MSTTSALTTYWKLLKGRAKYLRKAVKATIGETRGRCPICGYEGRFVNAGTPAVIDAKCPACDATPRHRLLKLVLDREVLIRPGSDVLHFAAERFMGPVIRATNPGSYVTADLKPGFDRRLNIEKLDLDDKSFDVVICSHVLEHVDDKAALSEMHRVLRNGGKAILMVPIIEGWDETYEDCTVADYRQRKLHFGGGTHVRYYGRDFRDRVKASGFVLAEYTMTPEEAMRYRLQRGERVFVASRA